MFMLLVFACARVPIAADSPPADYGPGRPGTLLLRGATVVGLGVSDVFIADGKVAAIGESTETPSETIELEGRFIAPAFIDSHVHLAYFPVAAELLSGGVAGALDLAAPEASLLSDPAPLRLLQSGPMVTSVDGYPTQSWGSGGYGVECADEAAVQAAVDRLVEGGAAVIKIPLNGDSGLSEALAAAAVERAHARGVPVVAHALDETNAALAARVGVDVLAHTPVSALSEATVAAFSGRAVISTLGAFGGDADTVDNLRRLRAAGATVLYGTDLGNTRTPGIDARELALLQEAGLDGEAILAAGTSAPAALWGFTGLGGLAVGQDASLLVLGADPLADPRELASPERVIILGSERPPAP